MIIPKKATIIIRCSLKTFQLSVHCNHYILSTEQFAPHLIICEEHKLSTAVQLCNLASCTGVFSLANWLNLVLLSTNNFISHWSKFEDYYSIWLSFALISSWIFTRVIYVTFVQNKIPLQSLRNNYVIIA